MKLTKKQRIALEFLAEVGPVRLTTINAIGVMRSLERRYMVMGRYPDFERYWYITKQGREALKEKYGD